MSVSSLIKMEVAGAASARASGNHDSNKQWPAGLSCAGAVAMSATSLLFAWLAAGMLCRCGAMDEEEVFSGVLWALSPLIWAYLYSWTAALSPARDGAGTVFKGTACLLLVAATVDKLMGPVAGAVAIVLPPLRSACACGRALAERLQRAGTERWSLAAVASTPCYQSRAEEVHEREGKRHAVFAIECMVFALSVTVWFVSWTSPEAKWEAPDDATEVVFFLAGPLFLAVRLMLPFLVGSPVLAAVDDMRALAAMIGVIGWLVAAASASALFGTIAGTVVVWMGELGMAGFLGYFLAVEAHYKELMVIKRAEPRRAKDASGLLDGRDSGDVCSAHIDVDAGVDCVLPSWW